MEKVRKIKKFYDLTEEDLAEMLERDVQAMKEGRYSSAEDVFKRLEEKYGI